MASITIRNFGGDRKTRLRLRAADNGRSIEEEARLVLRDVVGRKTSPWNLTSITNAFASTRRLLLHDLFVFQPFDEKNMVISSGRVGGGL